MRNRTAPCGPTQPLQLKRTFRKAGLLSLEPDMLLLIQCPESPRMPVVEKKQQRTALPSGDSPMRCLSPCCSYSITHPPFAVSQSFLTNGYFRMSCFVSNRSNIALAAVSRMGAPIPSSLFVLTCRQGLYDMLSVWDERESNPPACKRYTLLLFAFPISHHPILLPFVFPDLQKRVKNLCLMWINSGRLSTAVVCLHLVPFFNVQWSMFNGLKRQVITSSPVFLKLPQHLRLRSHRVVLLQVIKRTALLRLCHRSSSISCWLR